MPGNAGIYGAEPMTVRPPFMVLCQCNTPAEAREREAAAGCSACLKQAAVGLRKAYCPGCRYGLSARAGSFLSFYGKTVFCRREAGFFQKMGVTRPRLIMSPASAAICFGGSGASLFSQASIRPMQPDTRKE